MTLAPLGRSDVMISRIGFGCGPTAGLMTDGDEALQLAAVQRALGLGVTYFDTAPIYGAGASERALGAALRRLDARPVVATKVALEWDDLDDIPGAVLRSIEGSLSRLGLKTLDVVHIHNRVGSARAPRAEYGSGALLTLDDMLGSRSVVETLQTLQRHGHIRAIGGCAYGGDPERIRNMIDDGRLQSLLVNYSLLNPSAWHGGAPERNYDGVGAHAAARGLGVIALRALEAGRLTSVPTTVSPGDPLDGLRFLREDGDPIGAAIRYALGNKEVASVLIGFSNVQQIEHAVRAHGQGPLSATTRARIDSWREGAA
jgi:aryl-alcohol dehydrogenase-like predicted oxidoreductase